MVNNLFGNGGGGKNNTMMYILIACVCCCCCCSAAVAGMYFFNDSFKNWVNGLFGKKEESPGTNPDPGSGTTGTTTGMDDDDPVQSAGCVRDENIGGSIKYDPAACAGKCIFDPDQDDKTQQSYARKAMVDSNGNMTWQTVKLKENACSDWVISSQAGQPACPWRVNGQILTKPRMLPADSQGYQWCTANNVINGKKKIFRSILPNDAKAGERFTQTDKLTNNAFFRGGGSYGPPQKPTSGLTIKDYSITAK